MRVAGTLALMIGIGLRLARWLEARVRCRLDEVWIALNVLTRTPLESCRRYDNEQISPLGFLLGRMDNDAGIGGFEGARVCVYWST